MSDRYIGMLDGYCKARSPDGPAPDLTSHLCLRHSYEYKKVQHKLTVSPSLPAGDSMSGNVGFGGAATPRSGGASAGDLQQHLYASPAHQQQRGGAGSAAIAIAGARAASMERGGDEDEMDNESAEIYARSLAYQPKMPAMPAPFR